MSTRSHVRFIQHGRTSDGEKYTRESQLYKHSDGYPSGNIGVLSGLNDFLGKIGRFDGPDYLASQFIKYHFLFNQLSFRVDMETPDGLPVREAENGYEVKHETRGDWKPYDGEIVYEIGGSFKDPGTVVRNPRDLFDPDVVAEAGVYPWISIGVDVPGEIHGDIEYLYEVHLSRPLEGEEAKTVRQTLENELLPAWSLPYDDPRTVGELQSLLSRVEREIKDERMGTESFDEAYDALEITREKLADVLDSDGEWFVRVSDHGAFPTWDELEDFEGDPFDVTEWQFEGPLSVAYEAFCEE